MNLEDHYPYVIYFTFTYLNTVHISLQYNAKGEKQICKTNEEQLLHVLNAVQRLRHCMKCVGGSSGMKWREAERQELSFRNFLLV